MQGARGFAPFKPPAKPLTKEILVSRYVQGKIYYISISIMFHKHNKKIEKSAAGTVARAKPAYHSGSSNFSILRFALNERWVLYIIYSRS